MSWEYRPGLRLMDGSSDHPMFPVAWRGFMMMMMIKSFKGNSNMRHSFSTQSSICLLHTLGFFLVLSHSLLFFNLYPHTHPQFGQSVPRPSVSITETACRALRLEWEPSSHSVMRRDSTILCSATALRVTAGVWAIRVRKGPAPEHHLVPHNPTAMSKVRTPVEIPPLTIGPAEFVLYFYILKSHWMWKWTSNEKIKCCVKD